MNSRVISLIVVVVVAPVALWFWMQYCGVRMLDTDYATVGNPVMFQRVLGFPTPKGIDVTTVAGHHGAGTGMVWMKLNGDDKAFNALTANMVHLDKGFHYTIPSGFGVQKTFNADAQTAGWNDVESMPKPEVYMFQTAPGSESWNGNVVVDRATHTAYLSGSLVKSSDN